jgi:hypothetical protein
MKRRLVIVATVIFLLLINTSFWWQRNLGVAAMAIFVLLILYFIVLGFVLITYAWKSVEEGFADKQRIWVTVALVIVLGLTVLFPTGVINDEMFKSKVVLRAFREGVAGCGMSLTLRQDRSFSVTEVCFGFTETSGTYRMSNDSIFLKNGPDQERVYRLALIIKENASNKSYLVLHGDTLKHALPMEVTYISEEL